MKKKMRDIACEIVPQGLGVRKMIAWLLISRGILYIVGMPGAIAVLPYTSDVLFNWPLWSFGLLCLFSGVILLMTEYIRATPIGRASMIFVTAVCTFMAVGASGSYVQMATYIIMAMCGVKESATHDKDNTDDGC